MEIGKEEKPFVTEPVEEPVPRRESEPEPKPAPKPKREKVPA